MWRSTEREKKNNLEMKLVIQSGARLCRALYTMLWDFGVILSIRGRWRKRVTSSFENDYCGFCMDDKP